MKKRPFFEFGDFLVLLGAAMHLGGLYLLDWRVALAVAGGLIMALGIARLRGEA